MREEPPEGPSPGEPINQILRGLPVEEYARLEPHLERVHLEVRDLLFDVHARIEHVYFPEDGVCSIIGLMADGSAVETATVGNEGMVGLPVFHGTDRTSAQAFCQVPGHALRLSADIFATEVRRSQAFTLILHRYSQALFTLVGQSSACNRLHLMRQRCARWLLHTHDRVGASVDSFPLTHQFISQMLGVRRATVTEAMGQLQEANAIRYANGVIEIVDRSRLEAQACECYAVVRSEFDRLLGDRQSGGTVTRSPLDEIKSSENGKSTAGDAVPADDS